MEIAPFSKFRELKRSKLWIFMLSLLCCLFSFNYTYALEFEPDDVSGLSIWLKADSITGISDEEQFGFWGDSSSSTHDFSNSTSSKQPTYISSVPELNNKPAVRFDGDDDVFISNDTFSFGDFSSFVVYKDDEGGEGNDQFTKLLLKMDGTGTGFSDSSASNHTVTAVGDATQVSTPDSPLTPDSNVADFDGNGDYLAIPDSSDWDFGTNDFTIDMWVRLDNTSGEKRILTQGTNSPFNYWSFQITSSGTLMTVEHYDNNVATTAHQSFAFSANTWYHMAWVRQGTNMKMFINGVLLGTNTNIPSSWVNATGDVNVAKLTYISSQLTDGKIEELRVSKGIARWTENFTPPTAPFSKNSDKPFERLIDHNVADGFWLGRNDDIENSWGGGVQEDVSPFGIFVPADDTLPHILFSERSNDFHDLFGDGLALSRNQVPTDSTTTNAIAIGGLFDGNVGDNLGGDIAEVIIYDRALTDEEQSLVEEYLSEKYGIPVNAGIGTSEPQAKLSVNGVIQTVPRREAICNTEREGSIYYNSDDKKFFGCDGTDWIDFSGDGSSGGNDQFTKLLLKMDGTGAGFTDSSASNHTVTAVGDATQVATPDSPLTPDSNVASFDGNGDYLAIPDSSDWDFGTNDFTIDMWVRLDSTSGEKRILTQGTNSPFNYWSFQITSSGTLMTVEHYDNNVATTAHQSFAFSANTWYHMAWVRQGTNMKMFINGVLLGTNTNIPSSWVNATGDVNVAKLTYISSQLTDGKIEELRVSKGIARWTENFTPPTAPFK